MDRWDFRTLEELYLEPSRNGLTRPKSVRGSGYRMINMGEVFAHEHIGNIEMERVPMNEREIAAFSVRKGDLLFARQSLVAAGAGKCSIVKSADETTTFESHLIRVRLDQAKADPNFFFYYFLSPQGRANVQSLVMQVAAAGIRGSELSKLKLPYPPLPVQRRIAAILSTYDDLIDNNQRRITILEEMARSLYREWFIHFRFPGHDKVKMGPSPLGPIPQGWEVKKLGDISDLRWGDTSKTKASYVEEGFDAYSASGLDGKLDYYDFDRKGVVISAIGANCGKTWFASGKWSCIKNTIRFWSRDDRFSTEFLFIATLGEEFWPRRGAAQPFISQGDAERTQLICPDRSTMASFTSFVGPALQQITVLSARNGNLRRTRDLLLPRLLSGNVIA